MKKQNGAFTTNIRGFLPAAFISTIKFSVILVMFSVSIFAQKTYYVSSSAGDDSNDGTSVSKPWKTLNKISKTTFSPGDEILFKRGDKFYGEISKQGAGFIGTKDKPILFAPYGTGENPVFFGDFSDSRWTKTNGFDSVWQTWAGYTCSVQGWEDSLGTMRLMKENTGEIRFYLNKPDSLKKWLKCFSSSSFGYAAWSSVWDTMYVKTWNGEAPRVILFRNNIWSGQYLIVRDLVFRNWMSAINPYPMVCCSLLNLRFHQNRYISVFLAGHSNNNYIYNCVVDTGGYTGMYSWYSHGNVFSHDTVRNIQDMILGTCASIEQAGFGAERDTGTIFEYCHMENCEDGAFDSFYTFNDTIRYCSVVNCPTGYMLNGVGWVAHNNTYTTNGISADAGFKVDISYVFSGRTYLLSGGRTHIYNNEITVKGSGLWASNCAEGSDILFENNNVHGIASNTNFSRLETINTTSINNTFFGTGRWLTGTFPNQISYKKLEDFSSATGYESGSMWYSSPLGINSENSQPAEFYLSQNYPNPFNPTTTIEYTLPHADFVDLRVYNILGREIATLICEKKEKGTHSAVFDGSNFTSGEYFYRLRAANFVSTKKFVLVK